MWSCALQEFAQLHNMRMCWQRYSWNFDAIKVIYIHSCKSVELSFDICCFAQPNPVCNLFPCTLALLNMLCHISSINGTIFIHTYSGSHTAFWSLSGLIRGLCALFILGIMNDGKTVPLYTQIIYIFQFPGVYYRWYKAIPNITSLLHGWYCYEFVAWVTKPKVTRVICFQYSLYYGNTEFMIQTWNFIAWCSTNECSKEVLP